MGAPEAEIPVPSLADGGDAQQHPWRRPLTTLGACATIAATYWRYVRPRLLHWGATAAEFSALLPGDDLVPQPRYRTTRAVTISAPASHVWPWLAQLGYRRGGLYSYDRLDRVFGFLDRPSADRILPEFQRIQPGDVIPLGKGPAWPVHEVDAGHALVLAPTPPGMKISWAFVLKETDDRATRLISRVRGGWPPQFSTDTLARLVLEPTAFLMERRMLLGIKARAERLADESRRADERRAPGDTGSAGASPVPVALGIGLALAAYGLGVRSRLMTAGATKGEISRALPGDEIVPQPAMATTHAITIDAPPEAVWPWLMQMGPGRGGVYTYDWIENLMGLDMHSADRIHPEWQDLAVGHEFHLSKSGPPLRVEAIDPQRTLLLAMPDRTWSWVFCLEPAEGGRTRLIERNRMPVGRLTERLRLELLLPGAYLMERKMLRGITARAEQAGMC